MPRTGAWNHNIHYHDVVLRSIPKRCRLALDAGCGEGLLARQLAERCEEVVAIDSDHDTLMHAEAARDREANITYVEGDVLTYPFPENSFDFIAAVATLHHLPLNSALERFRKLLRSGGVLAVIGLYRVQSLPDYALAAAALPASWILRNMHQHAEVHAPLQQPGETLREIQEACNAMLPGSQFRRHLLFRYSMIWRKP